MEPKLENFFNRIKDDITYRRFNNLEDFKVLLSENIIHLISEKFRHYQEINEKFISLLDKYIFSIPKKLLEKLTKYT